MPKLDIKQYVTIQGKETVPENYHSIELTPERLAQMLERKLVTPSDQPDTYRLTPKGEEAFADQIINVSSLIIPDGRHRRGHGQD